VGEPLKIFQFTLSPAVPVNALLVTYT